MDYTTDFHRDVIAYPGKSLVVFGAPWCVPCKAIEMILEKFTQKIHIVKVNVDTNARYAYDCGISGIPVLMILNNGTPGQMLAGRITQAKIEELIQGA
jgi:thioredoxin 1